MAGLPDIFGADVAPRSTLSDAVARGELRRLARGVYTRNLDDPAGEVIRRHLFETVAAVCPGALISDRSARLGGVPSEDGSLFVVHERRSEVALPGLTVRPRQGLPATEEDLPMPAGLAMSSTARALLENAALSRGRGRRVPRTLTRPELEEWLESLLAQRGEDGFRALREQARALAPRLGLDGALASVLDPLMEAVLGTRRDAVAASPALQARKRGTPIDPRRVELFETLAAALDRLAPVSRPVLDPRAARYRYLPFFEAYFSNFIEGTEFAVDEAQQIVFEGLIPPARPADAHDILGTYELVSDPVEMARRPADGDELLALLAERHATLMEGRPDKRPGQFKREPNRVGTVEFVAPALVEGTLREAFDVYAGLSDPFSRAAFQLFLVSEVHPFDDGNGRIARVMMNAELTAAGEHRLIIPQVYRNNYLMALRALTVNSRTDPLVRMLQFAQRYTAAIDFSDLRQAQLTLQRTHAFHDPAEADMAGIRLTLPEPRDLPEPWRIVAGPREYTRTADGATIDIGWSWDIQRGTEQRTIRVEVADAVQSRPDLPPQARAAISSRGRSGIVEFLDRTDPPTRLLITTAGIFSQ